MVEVRCPNCGTSMKIGNGERPITRLTDGVHYLIPETIRNENKGTKTMEKEKIEKLEKMGFDTSKMFNVFSEEQINTLLNCTDDKVVNNIVAGGTIDNPKIYRRFITAHTFRLLQSDVYNHYDYNYAWTENMNKFYSYAYQFEMLIKELCTQVILEEKDIREFNIRQHFFNVHTAEYLMGDYLNKLSKYINNSLCTTKKSYHGTPYIKIHGSYISKFDYKPESLVKIYQSFMQCNNKTVRYAILTLNSFYHNKDFIKLPFMTTKCKEWVDGFKGAGAYYTLENLINFHNITLTEYETDFDLTKTASLHYLTKLLDKNRGEYYKLLALLVETVKKNNFNLQRSINRS